MKVTHHSNTEHADKDSVQAKLDRKSTVVPALAPPPFSVQAKPLPEGEEKKQAKTELEESPPQKERVDRKGIFTKLKVGAPNDKFEQEADAVAREVVQAPEPTVQKKENQGPKDFSRSEQGTAQRKASPFPAKTPFQAPTAPAISLKAQPADFTKSSDNQPEKKESGEETLVQTQKDRFNFDTPAAPPPAGGGTGEPPPGGKGGPNKPQNGQAGAEGAGSLESKIQASKGKGAPLNGATQKFMEDRIGADFSKVRVHEGKDAEQLNEQLGAKAFAHGSDIFFNKGQHKPDTTAGKELLAHELTHTVQQGASPGKEGKAAPDAGGPSVQRKISRTGTPTVQRGLFSSIGNAIADGASAVGDAISSGVEAVAEAIPSLEDLKNAALGQLAEFASNVPGFPLLTVVIGKNPITGNQVPRTAENMVGGVLSLIPGGNAKFQQLQQSGAISKAFSWVTGQLADLNITWSRAQSIFSEAWNSLGVDDLINPIGAIRRIAGLFTPLIDDITTFAGRCFDKVLEFIFEGFMGPGAIQVLTFLRGAGAVFRTIIEDPIGFLTNLVGAVRLGVGQFGGNIQTHLMNGLMGWLTGTMGEVGITLPETFDLKGIINLIFQILGLTWENIRAKLVERVGERAVAAAEAGVDIVKRIMTEGPIALWEWIQDKAADIKAQIMEGIRNWIITKVVQKGIIKLVSLFNPAGAIAQAVLLIYDAVMFLLGNWDRIKSFVDSIVSSLGRIAGGDLASAASFIEQSMAQTIPMILNFMAQFVGLGGIGQKIQSVVMRIRRPIDDAIDKGLDWVEKQIKKIAGKIRDGVDSVLNWWKAEKHFQADDGSDHELFYRGEGRTAQLFVASNNPRSIQNLLADSGTKRNEMNRGQKKAHADLTKLNTEIEALENKLEGGSSTNRDRDHKSLQDKLNTATRHLAKLLPLVDNGDVPDAILPAFTMGVKARDCESMYISQKTRMGTPSYNNDGSTLAGWNQLKGHINTITQKPLTHNNAYEKTHLLHESLGGEAADSNLISAHNSVNKNFRTMDNAAIAKKDAGKVLWHSMKVTFHPASPRNGNPRIDYSGYPRTITGRYGLIERKGTGWEKQGAEPEQINLSGIEIPDFGPSTKFNLNSMGDREFANITNGTTSVGRTMGTFIYNCRNPLRESKGPGGERIQRRQKNPFSGWSGNPNAFLERMENRKNNPLTRVPADYDAVMDLLTELYDNDQIRF